MTRKEKIGLGLFIWASLAAFTAEVYGTLWHGVACVLAMLGFIIFYLGDDANVL